jgi:hypothetical protein
MPQLTSHGNHGLQIVTPEPLAPGGQALNDNVKATETALDTLDAHAASTSNPHSVTAAQVGAAPAARTISTTAPLTGGGDLSANRTLAISAATSGAAGSMSPVHFAMLEAATADAVALALVRRDASGGFVASTVELTHWLLTNSINTFAGNLTVGADDGELSLTSGSGTIDCGNCDLANVNNHTKSVGITIDGAGQVISTGIKGIRPIDFKGNITGWRIVADQTGSIVVNVQHASSVTFPTFADNAGTEKPTLSSARQNSDTSISTWDVTTVSPGDFLQFVVDSATTVTRVTVILTFRVEI